MKISPTVRRAVSRMIPLIVTAEFLSLGFRLVTPDWTASHLLNLCDFGFLVLLGIDVMPETHHRRWTYRLSQWLYPIVPLAMLASQAALLSGQPEWTPHLLILGGFCALMPGMSAGWANLFHEDRLDRILSGRNA